MKTNLVLLDYGNDLILILIFVKIGASSDFQRYHSNMIWLEWYSSLGLIDLTDT